MSLTIENIVEQIPAVRATLAEDIQRRRHAVTAKRKELIDEITTVEELIRQFEPKCSEADARLIKALEDLDSDRKGKNAVLEERAKLQATVSGNKCRRFMLLPTTARSGRSAERAGGFSIFSGCCTRSIQSPRRHQQLAASDDVGSRDRHDLFRFRAFHHKFEVVQKEKKNG